MIKRFKSKSSIDQPCSVFCYRWVQLILILINSVFWGLCSSEAAEDAKPSPANLFIAADSTAVSNVEFVGWGDALKAYFDPTKLTVVNCSMGGTGCRNYVNLGTWNDLVFSKLKAGDFVVIQFGQSEKNEIDAPRNPGALPGVGSEHVEVKDADGKVLRVETFGYYIKKLLSDTKQRGATPILLCSGPANSWHAGVFHGTDIEPNKWVREIAAEQQVVLVDLFSGLSTEYQRIGPEKVRDFFPRDHVHTNLKGADFTAATIVAALKDDPHSALNDLLSEKGISVIPLSSKPKPKLKTIKKQSPEELPATQP